MPARWFLPEHKIARSFLRKGGWKKRYFESITKLMKCLCHTRLTLATNTRICQTENKLCGVDGVFFMYG